MDNQNTTKARLHFSFWLYLFLAIGMIVLSRLNFSGWVDMQVWWVTLIRGVLVASGAFLGARLIHSLIKKQMYRYLGHEVPYEQIILLDSLLRLGVFILPILFLLNHLGLTLNNITLILGLLTTGIAFAIRDILVSLLSWLMILLRKPFRIGNVIRIGEDTGKVIAIDAFFVSLQPDAGVEGNIIRVPNRVFLEKSVLIHYGNEIQEEIRWPVSSSLQVLPEDVLQNLLKKNILNNGNQASIELECQNSSPHLWLIIRYTLPIENRQKVRTHVLQELSKSEPPA